MKHHNKIKTKNETNKKQHSAKKGVKRRKKKCSNICVHVSVHVHVCVCVHVLYMKVSLILFFYFSVAQDLSKSCDPSHHLDVTL